MSKIEELKEMIASMLMLSPADIKPETSLKSLNNSLGNARIRLGLKRLGLPMPAGPSPATFGALLAGVSGEPILPAEQVPGTNPLSAPMTKNAGQPTFRGLQVGLDVELISSLPVAQDYWEHEFYQRMYSRAEIAYAVIQTEPPTHFAGFWCAKEALRKCDPAFRGISMTRTSVSHRADGRPFLTIETEASIEPLGHALSISHTSEIAAAVVVMAGSATMPVQSEVSQLPAPLPEPKANRSRRWMNLIRASAVLFGLVRIR